MVHAKYYLLFDTSVRPLLFAIPPERLAGLYQKSAMDSRLTPRLEVPPHDVASQ